MPYRKYKAKKITTDDGVFDSQGEYKRWLQLKEMEERGEIENLRRQVSYELLPKQKLPVPRISKKGTRQIHESSVTYVADFEYECGGHKVTEDFKGVLTPEYKIKRKLMLYKFGIEIRETY